MKKTILITGSTDGIGKLAAIKLAKAGHKVIIHGRNQEKLKSVIAEIKSQSDNDQVSGFQADFSDLSAVKEMATQVNDSINQIDVLINNAGVFKSPVATNQDGLDLRYVVNYFAPYVLTKALLPRLKASSNPRVINLSSAAQAPVDYEVLLGQKQGAERQTYAQSKLALTMWSFYLAKAMNDIAIIALNPGSLLNTNMVKEAFGQFWSSADKGANIIYDLAVSEKYHEITGKYFDNDKGSFGPAHADAYDEKKINKLIDTTVKLLVNNN